MTKVRHGSRSMYTHHGCRCPLCTGAQRLYMRKYLNGQRMVPVEQAQQRLARLTERGWTLNALVRELEELGYPIARTTLTQIRYGRWSNTKQSTLTALEAVDLRKRPPT